MAKSYYQKYKQPRAHVQVWTEANGPVPKGFVVDHINGDIHDNRAGESQACDCSSKHP